MPLLSDAFAATPIVPDTRTCCRRRDRRPTAASFASSAGGRDVERVDDHEDVGRSGILVPVDSTATVWEAAGEAGHGVEDGAHCFCRTRKCRPSQPGAPSRKTLAIPVWGPWKPIQRTAVPVKVSVARVGSPAAEGPLGRERRGPAAPWLRCVAERP